MSYGAGTIGAQGAQGAQGTQGIQGATGIAPVLSGNGSTIRITSAEVATTEMTTSTTYTNLTTTGPSVTVTTGTSALVIIQSTAWQDSTGQTLQRISFTITNSSGTVTHAASDSSSASGVHKYITTYTNMKNVIKVTGLTAGSNTFTMKYKTTGGRAGFNSRKITVIPL